MPSSEQEPGRVAYERSTTAISTRNSVWSGKDAQSFSGAAGSRHGGSGSYGRKPASGQELTGNAKRPEEGPWRRRMIRGTIWRTDEQAMRSGRHGRSQLATPSSLW